MHAPPEPQTRRAALAGDPVAKDNSDANVVALPKACGGEFFAIDKRTFEAACELGLNPAVAYLTIARGTGRDNAASFWSVNAIEEHTGISRPKAHAAIHLLIDRGLLTKERGGSRPLYRIVQGHEIPPRLTQDEGHQSHPASCLLCTRSRLRLT